MQIFLIVGPILAGLSAATALALGLTKTARLRRHGESLRAALDALPRGAVQRRALEDLHARTVAAAVARHECGWWPFTWPWIAWLGFGATAGQTSYLAAEHIATLPPKSFGWTTFAAEVYGTSVQEMVFTTIVGVLILSFVYLVYRARLMERATIERDLRDAGVLRKLVSLSEIQTHPASGAAPSRARAARGRRLWGWPVALITGLSPIGMGSAIGITIYIQTHRSAELSENEMGLTSFAILGLSLSVTTTMLLWAFVSSDVAHQRAVPETYPAASDTGHGEDAGYL